MDCGKFMDLSNADALALLNKTSECSNGGMVLNMSEMGGMAQMISAMFSMFQNRNRPLADAQEPVLEAKVEDPEPVNVPAPVLVVPEPEPEPLPAPVPLQVSPKRAREPEPEEQEVLEPLRKRVLRVEVPSEEDEKHEEWMPNDGTQWYAGFHSKVAPRVPTPRSARNVFAAAQRQTVNAEQVSDHIAPTNMPNLPPVIILTRAQCEEKIRELEAIFKVGLSRPEILAMRSAVATAGGYIKKLRLQIAEREVEAKIGEQLEEVFQYCDTLRQLAASRAVKRAVLASFPVRAVAV